MKSGNLNFLEPSEPLQACNGTDLPLPFTSIITATTPTTNTNFTNHTSITSSTNKVSNINGQLDATITILLISESAQHISSNHLLETC